MIAQLREVVEQRELLHNLTLRELRTRYRRSLLGWGWSLLNPVVITLCYTFVFSIVLRVQVPPGDPSGNTVFAFFLLAGLLPWNYLAATISGSTEALLRAQGLITKVYFPRELLVFGNVISAAVTLLIELSVVVVALLLAGFGRAALPLMLAWLIPIVAAQTLFGTGIALYLSALSVRSRDIPYLTSILLTVWFFVTPIVFAVENIPERGVVLGLDLPLRQLLLLNPMAQFALLYRDVLWDIGAPNLGRLVGLTLLSAVIFLAGYRFFNRRARTFAEDL